MRIGELSEGLKFPSSGGMRVAVFNEAVRRLLASGWSATDVPGKLANHEAVVRFSDASNTEVHREASASVFLVSKPKPGLSSAEIPGILERHMDPAGVIDEIEEAIDVLKLFEQLADRAFVSRIHGKTISVDFGNDSSKIFVAAPSANVTICGSDARMSSAHAMVEQHLPLRPWKNGPKRQRISTRVVPWDRLERILSSIDWTDWASISGELSRISDGDELSEALPESSPAIAESKASMEGVVFKSVVDALVAGGWTRQEIRAGRSGPIASLSMDGVNIELRDQDVSFIRIISRKLIHSVAKITPLKLPEDDPDDVLSRIGRSLKLIASMQKMAFEVFPGSERKARMRISSDVQMSGDGPAQTAMRICGKAGSSIIVLNGTEGSTRFGASLISAAYELCRIGSIRWRDLSPVLAGAIDGSVEAMVRALLSLQKAKTDPRKLSEAKVAWDPIATWPAVREELEGLGWVPVASKELTVMKELDDGSMAEFLVSAIPDGRAITFTTIALGQSRMYVSEESIFKRISPPEDVAEEIDSMTMRLSRIVRRFSPLRLEDQSIGIEKNGIISTDTLRSWEVSMHVHENANLVDVSVSSSRTGYRIARMPWSDAIQFFGDLRTSQDPDGTCMRYGAEEIQYEDYGDEEDVQDLLDFGELNEGIEVAGGIKAANQKRLSEAKAAWNPVAAWPAVRRELEGYGWTSYADGRGAKKVLGGGSTARFYLLNGIGAGETATRMEIEMGSSRLIGFENEIFSGIRPPEDAAEEIDAMADELSEMVQKVSVLALTKQQISFSRGSKEISLYDIIKKWQIWTSISSDMSKVTVTPTSPNGQKLMVPWMGWDEAVRFFDELRTSRDVRGTADRYGAWEDEGLNEGLKATWNRKAARKAITEALQRLGWKVIVPDSPIELSHPEVSDGRNSVVIHPTSVEIECWSGEEPSKSAITSMFSDMVLEMSPAEEVAQRIHDEALWISGANSRLAAAIPRNRLMTIEADESSLEARLKIERGMEILIGCSRSMSSFNVEVFDTGSFRNVRFGPMELVDVSRLVKEILDGADIDGLARDYGGVITEDAGKKARKNPASRLLESIGWDRDGISVIPGIQLNKKTVLAEGLRVGGVIPESSSELIRRGLESRGWEEFSVGYDGSCSLHSRIDGVDHTVSLRAEDGIVDVSAEDLAIRASEMRARRASIDVPDLILRIHPSMGSSEELADEVEGYCRRLMAEADRLSIGEGSLNVIFDSDWTPIDVTWKLGFVDGRVDLRRNALVVSLSQDDSLPGSPNAWFFERKFAVHEVMSAIVASGGSCRSLAAIAMATAPSYRERIGFDWTPDRSSELDEALISNGWSRRSGAISARGASRGPRLRTCVAE